MQLFINNWSTVLTAQSSAAATQLTVDPAEAANLTGLGSGDYYLLTLAMLDGGGSETAWEVVKATGKASGVVTIERAQEGTTALIWEVGSGVSARATKGTFDTLRDAGGSGVSPGAATPSPLGTASAGSATPYSREDHVHEMPTPADIGAATAAQGAKADTAVQPPALADKEQVLTAGTNVTIDRTDPDNPVINASITGGGGGDVVGPTSATANEVALFDGTTGKLLKGGGALGSAAASSTGDFAPSGHVGSGGSEHANVVAGGAAGFMTGADKTKLDGIASGATSNDTDTNLKDRANHTGSQPIASVTGLQAALDAKAAVGIEQVSASANYTLVIGDANKHLLHPSADTTARTFTIPANGSVAFPIGTAITFVNQNAAGVITIAITTDTMRLAGAGTTGSRTLAANGMATALKITATEWIISGSGLT